METNHLGTPEQVFSSSLMKMLLNVASPTDDAENTQGKKRISSEAARAAGHLLQLMVEQAIEKATIEAECESEAKGTNTDTHDEKIRIRADHITKIGAELLMDFS